ncbi:MAG: hypothetical protein LBC42_00690 [Puniceicoccales bacterium]|jgi:hypothetical protein|nr:hypothetical protein [Puniceicoccales bacterium]
MAPQNINLYHEWLGGALFLLSFVVFIDTRSRNVLGSLVLRWIRWGTIGFILACLLKIFSVPQAPFALLLSTGLLLWFLAESAVIWSHVYRCNVAEMPLGARYTVAENRTLWPNSHTWRLGQELLQSAGFEMECLASVDVNNAPFLLCPILISKDRRMRLVMRFSLNPSSRILPSAMLYSIDRSGTVFLTENSCAVFAGYYPTTWNVSRRPLVQSLMKLHALHCRKTKHASPMELLEPAVDSLNSLQQMLLEENILKNFLLSVQTNGKKVFYLAEDAGFRIWLEAFLLRYFGRPLS